MVFRSRIELKASQCQPNSLQTSYLQLLFSLSTRFCFLFLDCKIVQEKEDRNHQNRVDHLLFLFSAKDHHQLRSHHYNLHCLITPSFLQYLCALKTSLSLFLLLLGADFQYFFLMILTLASSMPLLLLLFILYLYLIFSHDFYSCLWNLISFDGVCFWIKPSPVSTLLEEMLHLLSLRFSNKLFTSSLVFLILQL